jgi:hypothetical protein
VKLASLLTSNVNIFLRLANQNDAAGEAHVLADSTRYVPRPKGRQLANLLAGGGWGNDQKVDFDAIALPDASDVDYRRHGIFAAACSQTSLHRWRNLGF